MQRARPILLTGLTGLIVASVVACGPGIKRDGTSITVPAGGSLQAALEEARPGDTITLEAGATFNGPFTLPTKNGADFITIQSSAIASLPDGVRVTPASAASMPKIVGAKAGQPAIRTATGAHHYKFVGLEIATAPGVTVFELVALGGTQTTLAEVPHDFLIDRCYIHGQPNETLKRTLSLNSAETTVQHSWFADAHALGQDSQAIAGFNGPGPFHILDNHLEGAGENIIFGGANPTIPQLVPSDIEVRGNHFFKPLAWKGGSWSVKNLFELKNARRVVVDGNVFENNWAAAQNGFAILYNCVDDMGWARVEDVQFTNNVIKHSGSGMNLGGSNPAIGCQMSRLVVRNNLWIDISGATWGGPGTLFQMANGTPGVVIDHNTGVQGGSILTFGGEPGPDLVFTNNIAPHNTYGMIGSGSGVGNSSLKHYFASYQVEHNAIVGLPSDVPAGFYPPKNLFPASLAAVGFTDAGNGDYRLLPSSPCRRAGLDGKDLGVDMDALRAAIKGPF